MHRPAYLDAISIRKIDKKGKVVGQHRFVGLFTSVAYNQSPQEIPLLRHRVEQVVQRAGFPRASHNRKALVNILETLPRDELFQMTDEELFTISIGVLQLQERHRIALFVRRDAFRRFFSCMVFVPKDQVNTRLRKQIVAVLEKAFQGTVSGVFTRVEESALARLQIIVVTPDAKDIEYDLKEIEGRLIEETRSWIDKLQELLTDHLGEERGLGMMRRYADGISQAYQESFPAQAGVHDLEKVDAVIDSGRPLFNLFRPIEAESDALRLKIFNDGNPIILSDILPILENMGVRVLAETPFSVKPRDRDHPVWVHDFTLSAGADVTIDVAAIKDRFHEALDVVWSGEMEDDGFNRLVLGAGLSWRQVTVLRAYCKFLRQAAFTFSEVYIAGALARNSGIAKLLVALFEMRFDPARQSDQPARAAVLLSEIETALEAVESLDEDRILRSYLNLIGATLRTNFYQTTGPDHVEGTHKPYISMKLDSQQIEGLPLPRPLVEVFVYSPRMEGTHLRGGRVARGGIRWSDRREDFRTEILGLLKAQMTKNSVIVPVGSKGGFVVKRPPAEGGRDALQAEGIECYKMLMRGLLDITDNLDIDQVVPPPMVVRHDDDDPYLVVAADKGTATFSDIANGVSRSYGFWLDDAFASGGSAGYDHKKMGITARGAWESVKRHFREIGVDTQTTDFTCVGCGDMSGDVFGNGMLLSKHIKLLGAFNHMHIFVDPDPDPAKSWAERKRLFDLPRSGWSDYSEKLISKGGAVFERRAKTLKLTPEIKKCFGIAKDQVTPNELIQAILTASVDLLWFGGIGTYVKAPDETHADTGDRANDGIRVNSGQLNCKVVGEGANLGVTMRGRIAFALRGGRINTDAIDNSAGVDCSDHEVNIKILLGDVVGRGDMTMKQRDQLLEAMTDDVAALCLRDNYQQTQTLTVAQKRGHERLDGHARLMRRLERAGRLDRVIEFLPDDEELADRDARRLGLTRPELSVILAYAKLTLYDALLASDLPDTDYLVTDLERYFPARLQKEHKDAIHRHRLRREIIATYVTNSLVNRGGETFLNDISEACGMPEAEIARGYLVAREAFDLRPVWEAIEALDNKVPAAVQADMLIDTQRLIQRATLWFMRNGRHPMDIANEIAAYRPGIAKLAAGLTDLLAEGDRERLMQKTALLVEDNVPKELAARIAGLDALFSGCDIVRLADSRKVEEVGGIYYAVGARFGIDWLRSAAQRVQPETRWDALAVDAIVSDLFSHQAAITEQVLAHHKARKPAAEAIDAWSAERSNSVERTLGAIQEMRSASAIEVAMLAVGNGHFRSLLT